jgi:hypothetical protein
VRAVAAKGALLLAVSPLSGILERRKAHGAAIIAIFGVQGLLLACVGVARSVQGVLAVAFGYMMFLPQLRACRTAIWQRKTPSGSTMRRRRRRR